MEGIPLLNKPLLHYPIPPIGKPRTKEYLGPMHLGHDHNNLLRLYEILLANSFGNKRFIQYQYRKKQELPTPVINYIGKSFVDIERKQHENEVIKPQYQHSFTIHYDPRNQHFPTTDHLDRHDNQEHYPNSTLFSCTTCGKSFYQKLYLEVHELLHVPIQHQAFECDICNKTFSSNVHLYVHQKHDHTEFPLIVRFSNPKDENSLQSEDSVQNSETIKFKCKLCNREFKDIKGFRRHRLIHEKSDIIYSCAQCNKTYRWKQNLKAHIKKSHILN